MSSIVLCIFEGLRSEQVIANNLFVHFLTETDKVILRASYGFNLYKLYQEISKDEFFDTYEIICEQLRARSGSLRPEESQVLDMFVFPNRKNEHDPRLFSTVFPPNPGVMDGPTSVVDGPN